MSDIPTPITGLLSDRIRPSCEAAPWVCEEVKNLERQLAEAQAQLHIADEQIALERGALTHVRNVLSRILADIPHNRDWLDPAVEREARDIVNS